MWWMVASKMPPSSPVSSFNSTWQFNQHNQVSQLSSVADKKCDQGDHSNHTSMLFRRRRTFVVFEEGHSLCSKKDTPCVRGRTALVFDERNSLCSRKDILCVRSRTFRVFQAGSSLCSKQNIPCDRSRTFLVFEAGHSLCSKQDIPCVPSRTSPAFQAGHYVWSKQEEMFQLEKSFQLQTYRSYPLKFVIFRARFFKAHDAMVSSDVVFLGSVFQAGHFLCSKQDIPCVPSRTRLKNREDGSDFDDFLTKTIAVA